MLKLYSWNVNGIRAVIRKDSLAPFVASESPDIICLQELKAKPDQFSLDLKGYETFWYPAEKPGYSGTSIFSKSKPLQVVDGLPQDIIKKFSVAGDLYGDPNLEGRVLAAEYDQFWLVTVYTPNAKENLSRLPMRYHNWDPAFLAYVKHLEVSKPVVFCGDLNVAYSEDDLAHPEANHGKKGFTDEERAGFQAYLDAGFIDTFRLFTKGNGHYTWWSPWAKARERNVGWRIDYFLVSAALKDKVISAAIHPGIMGSDHCPVSVTLNV